MSAALTPPPRLLIEPMVRAALLEDFGRAGDVTSDAVIPAGARARLAFTAREAGRLAGLDFAALAFELVDPAIRLERHIGDGASLAPGDVIAHVDGPARGLLAGERVALNFLGHLSGIASATGSIAAAIAHTRARIVCTRKTTPLLRIAEKYAVRAGGGVNHRFGLDDGILIKDNHIAIAGGVRPALSRARAAAGHMLRIEIEIDTLDQLAEALEAGADAVLLDNMGPDRLREAVAMVNGRAICEASGRITRDSAPALAETGVDLLSSGAITHSARTLDIGLDAE
ncbi:MAG: carboxylating nicotinate-nucleotide diphosphorylase [Alphaproteobacteria bacterium]|nr:carboxylating nicotinate-nucleotide diphosphorylase [Alphaproteobacteria bacterium]